MAKSKTKTVELKPGEFCFIIKPKADDPDSLALAFEHNADNVLTPAIIASTIVKEFMTSNFFISHVRVAWELSQRKAGLIDDDG